jgi:hypothetical protein
VRRAAARASDPSRISKKTKRQSSKDEKRNCVAVWNQACEVLRSSRHPSAFRPMHGGMHDSEFRPNTRRLEGGEELPPLFFFALCNLSRVLGLCAIGPHRNHAKPLAGLILSLCNTFLHRLYYARPKP